MNTTETILNLKNLIEYCKRQIVLADHIEHMSYEERQQRKREMQYNLIRAMEYYYEITSSHYDKVA